MTEPGTGSDLAGIKTTAIRADGHYLVNGAKTFITNGINADLVIVAVKTDPRERHRGISLLAPRARHGGLRARPQPREDRPALAGHRRAVLRRRRRARRPTCSARRAQGFRYLVSNLAQERLSIAIGALGAARAGLATTLDYVREPPGVRPGDRHASRTRASNSPSATARSRSRRRTSTAASRRSRAGELTAEDAAVAKWWCTELQGRVLDRCVQLHGGYGYMAEYPIARAWADARATRIFGGTNEIMREIIGRSLGL